MKIFYAVQATGNGHISRAIQLLPYLEKIGNIDVFLSGSNATLKSNLPVKYTSRGMSLFYTSNGGLDYKKMWKQNSLWRAEKEAAQLPLEKYDIVINDFEYITARACKIKKLPSVQFGHQASFYSKLTPRPEKISMLGEMVLKNYAPSTHYVGLHFQPYDSFIFYPVVKQAFLSASLVSNDHITVYLPAFDQSCIQKHLLAVKQQQFHWFLRSIKRPYREGNISYFPIDEEEFNKSLISCKGAITSAGFEMPAEVLYMKKKLMCIPIRAQYEQLCNAAALQKMGVTIIHNANTNHFANDIINWLNEKQPEINQPANNIEDTLAYLTKIIR